MKRRCKHTFKVKVNLYLDIPLALMHKLNKTMLRNKLVQIEGADWPEAVIYCTKCGATL